MFVLITTYEKKTASNAENCAQARKCVTRTSSDASSLCQSLRFACNKNLTKIQTEKDARTKTAHLQEMLSIPCSRKNDEGKNNKRKTFNYVHLLQVRAQNSFYKGEKSAKKTQERAKFIKNSF